MTLGFQSPNRPPTSRTGHDTASAIRAQKGFIRDQRIGSDCLSTFNLLTSDILFDEIERRLPAHRERLFPPTETLAMFITQTLSADRSCQQVVNQASIQRLVSGLPVCSTHTGGYCKARQRLPLEMISGLTRHLGQRIDQRMPQQWRWHGRRVRLVDGTTLTMPDTASNQADYPKHGGQKDGLGFPICRLVSITCLSSGSVLDAAIGRFNGKGGDEQTLLRSIQEALQTGDILLGDAYFPTFFLIAAMQARGVDMVMEQLGGRKRVTDFRRGKKLGQRDHLITLNKPRKKPFWMSDVEYCNAPDALTVRELKAGGKIMVTTLLCPKTAPKSDLKVLYKRRWCAELDLRHIKDTMGMDVLSCQTPQMVRKEIWVYLLAYNLIRLLMVQAALIADTVPRAISFKHCLQLWLLFSQQADTSNEQHLYAVCVLMAQQRVGDRPGRVEPRAVKRRPKPYPLLNQPRESARQKVRRFGHPKKLK